MISRTPWRAMCSIRYSITGLPKMGTIGLGKSLVNGRTRVPCPAARIMPLVIFSSLNARACELFWPPIKTF